ncbi:polysaccharide lyase family 1 protein [Tulasnella calospora MUT 4182]|uniref:pectin lyase n=1 Tax=Tulasnella calospora MUT 4182 TaxID=1051891 RepID=A0A0C3Q6C4_9AGAM|nr:polysaccharide lyase family 1 protein [Tulasnella calospora MUT 4182]
MQAVPVSTKYNVTYNTAGADKNLVVASNKTILGQGSNAGIKGIGLRMNGVSNIIIQNIQITDLNPQYVWGGDASELISSSIPNLL